MLHELVLNSCVRRQVNRARPWCVGAAALDSENIARGWRPRAKLAKIAGDIDVLSNDSIGISNAELHWHCGSTAAADFLTRVNSHGRNTSRTHARDIKIHRRVSLDGNNTTGTSGFGGI